MTSVMYLYFDYMFFYSAFTQAEKLFAYFVELEKQQQLISPPSTASIVS